MRIIPTALAPTGPSLVLAAVLVVLALGSGGMLVANEIAARDGERSTFFVEESHGERFEDVKRVHADSNAGTSVAFSRLAYPEDGSAEAVVLGRDDVFADNLAAGLLQTNGPLLLTDPKQLNATVRDEIRRLGAQKVTIVGGSKAISPQIESELRGLGLQVTRVAGATRIETALAIAEQAPWTGKAVLVRARDSQGGDGSQAWADSLAAGAFAAASGVPVLLTDSQQLHPKVAPWLAHHGIAQVYGIGGNAALAPAVLQAAGSVAAEVTRVSGTERAATAVAVAEQLWGFSTSKKSGNVVLVDGFANDSWATGAVAAAYAARFGAPLMLANGSSIPPATERWITQGGGTLVCGSSVRDNACESAAARPADQAQGQPSQSPVPSATPTQTPTATPSATPSPPVDPPTIVQLQNSRPGQAMFTLSNLWPGDESTRRITVRNSGNVALKVRLHGRVTGDFASALQVQVVLEPDGEATTIYDGTLEDFALQHSNYTSGTGEQHLVRSAQREYEFIVSVPAGSHYSGNEGATATFVWEGRT